MGNKFREGVEELKQRGSDRKEPALESTIEALERLGNPEEDYDVVLVGGTNGKGSTVEMISEALQHQGKRVGESRSPHLVDARERIQFNGQKISEDEFVEIYEEIAGLDLENELTFFEFMTVAAYLYFSRREADYAVMEVGMGGRLDATNAASPELAVITNVGKDHTNYLGETLNEIAEEKAGILPENGKAVLRDSLPPILEAASERSTEILEPLDLEKLGEKYIFRDRQFKLPVKGEFQKQNLETALRALEQLGSIPEDLEEAFSGVECRGRMEVISHDPPYIHDGAHNPPALRKVIEDFPEDFVCVFSALESKPLEEMVEIIEQKASKFYLTKSDFFKAEEPEKLAEKVSIPHEIEEKPAQAVEKALNDGRPVIVTGSLYLVGNVKEARGE